MEIAIPLTHPCKICIAFINALIKVELPLSFIAYSWAVFVPDFPLSFKDLLVCFTHICVTEQIEKEALI